MVTDDAVRISRSDRVLRYAGLAFAVGLTSHGIDHALRGTDVVTSVVMGAGNFQVALALVTLVLVFMGHRFGAFAAVVTGFASAVGFSLAHLLPTWSAFSRALKRGRLVSG